MGKLIVIGTALTVVALVGGIALWLFGGRFAAPIRGVTEQVEITNKGSYRIRGYEMFYDLVEQRNAVDVKLAGYPEVLTAREATECRGLLARRADIVARYNAAAQAELTTGQWRADNLPDHLEQQNPRFCEVK